MTTVGTPPSSDAWDQIREDFFASGDAQAALAQRTALVDGIVVPAWEQIVAPVAAGPSLLAVGGYGRRQLFPYSDVDLLLLAASERAAEFLKPPISAFLQHLWDAGLRVSHSVRTPDECLALHEGNLELTISLLDRRYLAGNGEMFGQVADGLPRFLRSEREHIVRRLSRMAGDRHAKYQGTIHHLEPDIKESPGGLRDLQLVRWLRRLGGEESALIELQEPQQFLFRLRCSLHYLAGRDNNLLSFDAQERAAERQGRLDTARWMREYFRHARTVHRSLLREIELSAPRSQNLITQFREWRSRLSNADFSVTRERVWFRAPHRLEVEPEFALSIFEFVARHGVSLSLDAEQRLSSVLPQLRSHFSEARPVWPILERVLSLTHAPLALRSMLETGVLGAVFPEIERIECLVVRDFYHRYTVDEHSLIAIEVLSGLKEGVYAELLSESDQRAPLLFALLFHDTGKGAGGNHIFHSLTAAGEAMERIGMPAPAREVARFLIENHLEMSNMLQSRDLGEPSTGASIARVVGTVERLKALTLLTYADISAVNPQAMTAWRSQQLWRLYLAAYHQLTSGLDAERITEPAMVEGVSAEFLEGLPVRYLRTHTPAGIRAHERLYRLSRERGVSVGLEKEPGGYRATLIAHDRPNLFASAAGAISSFGMNILKAEAFANCHGIVLDTFVFDDPSRTLELNPTEVERLQATLERVLAAKMDVRRLLQNRPKTAIPSRGARLRATVAFDNQASPASTLIEIVAEDRPGLLYDLARAISQQDLNIEVVLIDTEAHKAIDVFYVTYEGHKLDAQQQEALRASLLKACAGLPDPSGRA